MSGLSPVSHAPPLRFIPDDGGGGRTPTAGERTDQAIAQYRKDLANGENPSVLNNDRKAIDDAVAAEIEMKIDAEPGRDKTDRRPLEESVQQYGDDILARHPDLSAVEREEVQGAVDTYKTAATTWAPEDRGKVDAYIKQAMDAHPDDIQGAFEQLRDMRWEPGHFYDTNLAIAADYLRARWETQKYNNVVASLEVSQYLDKKRNDEIPQNGPGPVSPYSELQKEYMEKGINDQWDTLNWFEKAFLSDSSVTISGVVQAAFENDVS